MKYRRFFLLLIAVLMGVFLNCKETEPANPLMVIETSEGIIEVELFPDVAPLHVENFMKLAAEGFYDSLKIFRLIPDFMFQSGDPENRGTGSSGKNIPAEFNDSLHHYGTLAMARSATPNSASCQFYICLGETKRLSYLDHKYTVFGRTVSGFEVLKKIASAATSGGMQRIQKDPNWRAELKRLGEEEGADVIFRPDGSPWPDRPLQTIWMNRVYEKK